MAGYSKNPLWKKLGIKENFNCYLFESPSNYFELLEAIPENADFTDEMNSAPYDFQHAFVTDLTQLETNWKSWQRALKKDGSLWISWPKGGSKIPTNLNGNIVRSFGLNEGLVDVKVCAVDDDWSGLKFMYRKTDR